MTITHTAPRFADRTARDQVKGRFQFAACGTNQMGVLYVTLPLTADRAADIAKAAKIAAKRAGADEVTIHGID
jgi:hypothetical protein